MALSPHIYNQQVTGAINIYILAAFAGGGGASVVLP